jgi:hypothetical protein
MRMYSCKTGSSSAEKEGNFRNGSNGRAVNRDERPAYGLNVGVCRGGRILDYLLTTDH